MSLREHAIDGAFWNVGMALCTKAVTALGQLALAWLLLPSDVGLANLAVAMVAFTAILGTAGLGDVLIQRRRYDEEAGQALWLSLLSSGLIGAAVAGMALAAPLMGQPHIRGLLLALVVGIVLGFPTTVLTAGYKDRLDFKGLALAQMAAGVSYALTAVFLAWAGWGPYSLVAAAVVQQMAFVAAMLMRGGGLPWVRPSWAAQRPLVKPAFAISLTGFFVGLQIQAPLFVCSWTLGASSLGYFSWGWAIAGQAVFLFATNMREVVLPTFTHLKDDPPHRAEVAMRVARVLTALLCVTLGTQALLARVLVTAFLPPKWLPGVPVIICASVGLVGQGLWITGSAWLNACGRYRMLLRVAVFQTAAAVALTWAGLHWWGMVGASVGCGLGLLVGSMVSLSSMGVDTLARATRSWRLPLLVTSLTWTACFSLSYGNSARELASAALFVAVTWWIWWREDDGSMAAIGAKIASLAGMRPAVRDAF